MRIYHLRNATMAIESKQKVLLVDPMLGKKGSSAPPFTFFRFKPQRNPIIDLPEKAMEIVSKTTHCLLTHLHPDHLDKAGENFLKTNGIPVICSNRDKKALEKKGLNVLQTISYWENSEFLGGTIQGIPAKHGYGFIAKPMGNVMGYFLKLPNEQSIYLSSDTIYTKAVHKVLVEYQPQINVVACGSAQLDVFRPLLMTMEDVVRFVENAKGTVIANHLEALNHCPTTRAQLTSVLANKGLLHKILIPEDGQIITFN